MTTNTYKPVTMLVTVLCIVIAIRIIYQKRAKRALPPSPTTLHTIVTDVQRMKGGHVTKATDTIYHTANTQLMTSQLPWIQQCTHPLTSLELIFKVTLIILGLLERPLSRPLV